MILHVQSVEQLWRCRTQWHTLANKQPAEILKPDLGATAKKSTILIDRNLCVPIVKQFLLLSHMLRERERIKEIERERERERMKGILKKRERERE